MAPRRRERSRASTTAPGTPGNNNAEHYSSTNLAEPDTPDHPPTDTLGVSESTSSEDNGGNSHSSPAPSSGPEQTRKRGRRNRECLEAERGLAARQALRDTVHGVAQHVTVARLGHSLYNALEPLLWLANFNLWLLRRTWPVIAIPLVLLLSIVATLNTAHGWCESSLALRQSSYYLTWLGAPDICTAVKPPSPRHTLTQSPTLAHGLDETEKLLKRLAARNSHVEMTLKAFGDIDNLVSSVTNFVRLGKGTFTDRGALLDSLDAVFSAAPAVSDLMARFHNAEDYYRDNLLLGIDRLSKASEVTFAIESRRWNIEYWIEDALWYIWPDSFLNTHTARFIARYSEFLEKQSAMSESLARQAQTVADALRGFKTHLLNALRIIEQEHEEMSKTCEPTSEVHTVLYVIRSTSTLSLPRFCYRDINKQVEKVRILLAIIEWLMQLTSDAYDEHREVVQNIEFIDQFLKESIEEATTSFFKNALSRDLKAHDRFPGHLDPESARKRLLAVVDDVLALSDHVKRGKLLRDGQKRPQYTRPSVLPIKTTLSTSCKPLKP